MAQTRKLSPLSIVLILSGTFFVLFLIISGALYLGRGSGGGKSGHGGLGGGVFGSGEIGIVEINGAIMDSKKTLKALERFEDDTDVKAIVLRLNSPGGAVGPSQEIYEAVKNYKKPVVASMSSVAASGAYYIACGAKKVYANAGTITGSIGVIMEFADLEKLYEWAKVKRFSIKTGHFKDIGAEYREMGADERALLQGMIDNVLGQFKRAVADGRHLPLERVTQIADGRIFSGEQAKAEHLVDEVGSFKTAVEDAAKMAGLTGKPNLVYPAKKSRGILDFVQSMDRGNDDDSESKLDAPAVAGGLAGLIRQAIGVEFAPTAILPPGMYWLWRGGY